MKKRLIIASHYSSIEPLGLMCLATVAIKAGWEVKIFLAKNRSFGPVAEEAISFGASIVAFSVWTGYHLQIFSACSKLQSLGIKVAMGGPHVTYFAEECRRYSDWTVKGDGFKMFRLILEGNLPEGIHFDPEHLCDGFPEPARNFVYESYPEFAASPIKSVICSLGCPFSCSYCYNSLYKKIYKGFKLNVRPVDSVIQEVLEIQKRWPLSLVYFQDDIFGFNFGWLAEFAGKWKEKVGLPWHCQIRLELARDERRLDLFKEGGCTGITVAIESGNSFLRRFVLLRRMSDKVIIDGVKNIKKRGLAIRTEQILAVPFSTIETDLETLKMNIALNPSMAWSSILVPYVGTEMGNLALNLGFYDGHNDDISDTFFGMSVLRHVKEGYKGVERAVLKYQDGFTSSPLMKMTAVGDGEAGKADLYLSLDGGKKMPVCSVKYLGDRQNEFYSNQAIILQRLFLWLAMVPEGEKLGRRILEFAPKRLSWKAIGDMTKEHLLNIDFAKQASSWPEKLAEEMGFKSSASLPTIARENPYYFCFFPNSGDFADKASASCAPFSRDWKQFLNALGAFSRRWLYTYSLYKLEPATDPIASE